MNYDIKVTKKMKCGDVVGFPVVQTTTPLADYKTGLVGVLKLTT